MRERHYQSGDKHPRTCTCTECHRKRLQALEDASRLRKRKPKSQRGQAVSKRSSKRKATPHSAAQDSQAAVDEALRLLGIESDENQSDD